MKYKSIGEECLAAGIPWNGDSPAKILQYAVGALLYAPANHPKMASYLCERKYAHLKSLALCMEDAIPEQSVPQAEDIFIETLKKVHQALFAGKLDANALPLIFVRVRGSEQMQRLFDRARDFLTIFSGFILPKFSPENFKEYDKVLDYMDTRCSSRRMYVMPIIETRSAIKLETRTQTLLSIQRAVAQWGDTVLNIRVGGNDFCSLYGVRRNIKNTIYDIGVVRDALMDILNVFAMDYVVSAPVWEYFGSNHLGWQEGFLAELALDRLNGFVGKTVIHPSQLPFVQQGLMVEYEDYMDAREILGWKNKNLAVGGGVHSHRMNEVKVHKQWAEKTMMLAQIYGVRKKRNKVEIHDGSHL